MAPCCAAFAPSAIPARAQKLSPSKTADQEEEPEQCRSFMCRAESRGRDLEGATALCRRMRSQSPLCGVGPYRAVESKGERAVHGAIVTAEDRAEGWAALLATDSASVADLTVWVRDIPIPAT